MAFFSYTLTTSTAAQIIATQNISFVKNIMISVRSMGTCTYIGIGARDTQAKRLLSVADVFSMGQNYKNDSVDIRGLFFIADAADGVLEIVGDSV